MVERAAERARSALHEGTMSRELEGDLSRVDPYALAERILNGHSREAAEPMTQTIDRAERHPVAPTLRETADAPPIPSDTLGGLPLEPWYGPDASPIDVERDLGEPGVVPVHPRRAPDHVPRQGLDDAPVRRLRQRARTPTSATGSCSLRDRWASRSPSTCRRSWATTRTRRTRSARSAAAASRSTRSRTC